VGSRELLDESPERIATLLEVVELVKARCRRREQDDVAGLGVRARVRKRSFEIRE